MKYRKRYQIAGVIFDIRNDTAFKRSIDEQKFRKFIFNGKNSKGIRFFIHHHNVPQIKIQGKLIYEKPPWKIYQTKNDFIYEMLVRNTIKSPLIAIFNHKYDEGHIYHYTEMSKRKPYTTLLTFPTDRIIFSSLLAKREGVIFHACGFILDNKGFTFLGHSEYGKSAIIKLFSNRAKILNDENIIVKKRGRRFRVYGTPWHGEIELVSPDSAPLEALFFLHKARENRLKVVNKKEAVLNLFDCAIKPLITKEWTEKTLKLCEEIADKVPCYHLYFKKDKSVVEFLKRKIFDKQRS